MQTKKHGFYLGSKKHLKYKYANLPQAASHPVHVIFPVSRLWQFSSPSLNLPFCIYPSLGLWLPPDTLKVFYYFQGDVRHCYHSLRPPVT